MKPTALGVVQRTTRAAGKYSKQLTTSPGSHPSLTRESKQGGSFSYPGGSVALEAFGELTDGWAPHNSSFSRTSFLSLSFHFYKDVTVLPVCVTGA